MYVEVKGYWTDAARYKMADVQVRNNVNILIVESMPEVLSIKKLILEKHKLISDKGE